jgi:hypothetical protein
VAVCKIGDCRNDGAYSCNTCGRLFCGRHGIVANVNFVDAECESCRAARNLPKKRHRGAGCLTAAILFAVGIALAYIAMNTVPTNLFAAFGGAVLILGSIFLALVNLG